MKRKPTQQDLPLPKPRYKWGGPREGAGRPKSGRAVGVAHRRRPYHERSHPVHVTLRVRRELPSLREPRVARIIGNAIRAHTRRTPAPRMRVVHFSIQPTHIHLLVEAPDKLRL